MKRLIFPVLLVVFLTACATMAPVPDPACPDNLVFLNGEELAGLLLDIRDGEVHFALLSGEKKIYPQSDILRVDLGHRVGDPQLEMLSDLDDAEILQLIKQAAGEEVDPGKPVTVLLSEQYARLEESGVTQGYYRQLFRVDGNPGLRFANTSFTYNPKYTSVKVEFGYAISTDGKVSILSTGSVRDSDLGDGRPDGRQLRRLQIAVPDAEVKGFVYFQFTFTRKPNPWDPFLVDRTFVSEYPMRNARTIIDVPADIELAFYESRLDPLVVKTDRRENGRRVIAYVAAELPESLGEPRMPAWSEVAPYFCVGAKNDWPSLAALYRQRLIHRLKPDEAVVEMAKKIAGDGSPREQAEALYAFVLREVEDNGVLMTDRDPWPKPPGQTLADRRGNLIDRTALLLALAKSVGLDADFCLVASWSGHNPVEQVPHPDFLYQSVLRFMFGEQQVWVSLDYDCRVFGQLSADTGDSFFLDITTGETGRTPPAGPEINHAHFNYDIHIRPDGAARIVEHHQLYGQFALSPRNYRHYEDEVMRDEMISRVAGFALRNRLVDYSIEDIQGLSDPIVVRRESETPMFVVGSGGKYFVLRLFDLARGDIARVFPQRRYPLQRSTLNVVQNTYRFHLSPGMTVRNLPAPVRADCLWGTYRAQWTLAGDLLTFTDTTEYTERTMPAAGFDDYEALLRVRRETSEVVLVVEQAREEDAAAEAE